MTAIRMALITVTGDRGVRRFPLGAAVTSMFVVKAALDPAESSSLVLEHAPGFALADPSGETVRLEDHKGSRFILAFWASWDPVSEAAVSELNSLFDAGVPVIGVNLMEGSGQGLGRDTALLHPLPGRPRPRRKCGASLLGTSNAEHLCD